VSRFLAPVRPGATSDVTRTDDARLHGRSLVAVRLGWAIVAALAVGLFAAGVRSEMVQLQSPCLTPVCTTGQLPPEGLAALSGLGLTPALYAGITVAMDIVFAAAYTFVGVLIFWRRSEDRVAVFASLALLIFGTATFGFTMAALAAQHPAFQGPVALLHFVGAAFFGLFLYTFPDGRFVPRWTRWVAGLWIGWQLIEQIYPAWATDPSGWQPLVESVVWLAALGTVVFSQIRRYLHASSLGERQQIKWVVFGISVAFAGFLVINVILSALDAAPEPATPASVLAYLIGYTFASYLIMLLVPVSIGIAMLRYHLFDVDLVINRTLVYGTLTACVIGLYVLVVGSLGTLVQSRGNLLVSLVAVGLIAVVFAPLRGRLQRTVNRLLYGDRDEPYAVVSRLGERLEATLTPDAVLPTVVLTLKERLKLSYAAIELVQGGTTSTAASIGEPVPNPIRLPLLYGGETLGRLVLGPRAGEETFRPGERRLLQDLAHQTGIAVHAVRLGEQAIRLSQDLQRSRERLVTAREEERRRLRRDLHDGLGPQLAALTMTAEAARDSIAADPVRAEALLNELIEQTLDAVADIRRVAYDLRPPALDAIGLVGALRMHASQHTSLQVSVFTPDELPSLSAAVEVAIYRIAAEALSNVVNHAGASTCTLRLAANEQASTVRLDVTDDGRGIAADRGTGVGLSSMRERAAELGGSFTVAARAPKGTIVSAVLPYAASHPLER
jgi:signal transduction histidine kinase